MQYSQLPTKFPIPWANAAGGGYIRTIPTASQQGINAGQASLTDGFVPLNFQPVGSGGIPPSGQDMNGILNQITAWCRAQAAGQLTTFDAAFASAIGGYPMYAMLASTTPGFLWVSSVDNNTSNPDGASPSGWTAVGSSATQISNYVTNNRVPSQMIYVSNNTRVALSGSGANNYYSAISNFVDVYGNPYKKTGTASQTKLYCLAEIVSYVTTAGGAGATAMRITDGTNFSLVKQLTGQINISNVGAVAIPGIALFVLNNVPAGNINLTLQVGRLDATSWGPHAFNPDAADYAGSGSHTSTGSTSALTCWELPV